MEYCAYSHLQRQMSFDSSEVTETDFKVLTASGKTGVHFLEAIDSKLLE